MRDPNVLEVRLLGDNDWISASDICRLCVIDLTAVVELVDLGVVSSRGASPDEWLLPATALPRLRIVGRLMRDLGVNVTGAALALELLETQRDLERRISGLERLVHR
jgi:chaperone modulatory protein CbpM